MRFSFVKVLILYVLAAKLRYRVHAWVGQIVTFFAYSLPARPLGSPTPRVILRSGTSLPGKI